MSGLNFFPAYSEINKILTMKIATGMTLPRKDIHISRHHLWCSRFGLGNGTSLCSIMVYQPDSWTGPKVA